MQLKNICFYHVLSWFAEGDDTTEGGLSDRVSEGMITFNLSSTPCELWVYVLFPGSKSVAESEGHTSGGSRAFAANLPMDEIRTVQRRFAMLLWAHELPRDLQFTLLDLKEKAKEQEDANSVCSLLFRRIKLCL